MTKNNQRRIVLLIFIAIVMGLLQVTPVLADQVPAQQEVGGKTFVYRNGLWIDASFDAARHPVYQIGLQSDEYRQLTLVYTTHHNRFSRLGEHYLVVIDGWGIEIQNGRESGPLVSTEQRRPSFLNQYNPPQPIITTQNKPTDEPTLLASSTVNDGFRIQIEMSWGELIGLAVVGILLGIGIWQNQKEASESNNIENALLEEE